MNIYILPYKRGSKSAKALAEALGGKRIRLKNSKFRPRADRLVINWGNSNAVTESLTLEPQMLLNHPESIRTASNKLSAFELWAGTGVPIPDYTSDREVANGWLQAGEVVVCRSILNGHGGNGISLVNPDRANLPVADGGLPVCPLYTRYVKKTAEYRIHVFNGQVIDVQQKRKRLDAENVDYKIRNHANGWVFCREDVDPPQAALEAAIRAVATLDLDFGAVDLVYNRYSGVYVLEVNTAPGLEGTTLEKYTEAVRKLIGEMV